MPGGRRLTEELAHLLLIETINIMVFVSLSPFLSKRFLVFFFALLALSAITTFAESTLFSVGATPYDHQMARIQPVLTCGTERNENLSIQVVNHWMSDLRGIPYGYLTQWRRPEEVAHDSVADCKGKAVSLYERMRAHGAHNLRLVIGKRAPTSRVTHTWVEWTYGRQTYVLDPTINWTACLVSTTSSNSYVPYFAFDGSKKYRATSASDLYARL